MHLRHCARPAVLAAAGMLLAALLSACGDGAPAATVDVSQPATVAPTVSPPSPLPTPHPGNTTWVRQRLDAVIALYRPTPAGAALLRSLDLRQMLGEPGFFGSYGFDSWAGVGEARPIGVMHELMHSYWGGFPVMGRPELEWRRDGDAAAPALAAYHRDILAFMAQPPDDYEFLRQRLRNLPGVSAANTEPLFHSLEADLPYATGGDLGLVPPILRKYWGMFLATGPFYDWDQAVGWFQSLPPPDRAVAGGYLGFEHLDLRQYGNLPPYAAPGVGLAGAAETLAGEERQRLADFAAQFDLLVGEAQLETDFQFWRRYLRDKVYLFRRHPGHLESLGPGRARELSGALEFMSRLEGEPAARAAMLTDGIAAQPLLVNFLPAADHLTLLELFAANPELPDAPTLQATASFAQRLQPFAAAVDRVLAAGRQSPERGAQALAGFLADTGLEAEQELRLFFGLFRDAGPDAARRITAALDKATVRALLPPAPVELRTILPPEDLLDKLDITADAADADLRRGLGLLLGEPSGNYRIDEPFLEAMYEVMAARAQASPSAALRVMADTPFPLEGMIRRQPGAVAAALGSDLALAADLVMGGDPVTSPPARIIYRLIAADPALAAGVVIALDGRGESGLVAESLAYFAYDQVRAEKYSRLSIYIGGNGAFLRALLERQGAEWLEARLAGAVSLYRGRAAAGEVAPDFLRHYRDTLDAAASAAGPEAGGRLAAIIRAAFPPG